MSERYNNANRKRRDNGGILKNILIGLLALLVICSTALNVYMFTQLKKMQGNSAQNQITSNVNTIPSDVASNINTTNFNTYLIGDWTDGDDGRFRVMKDGSAYRVGYSEWEGSGGKFVYSLDYGYMDGSNFVVRQSYRYENTMNGGDGIYRHSDEEVIANCLHDRGVSTYRIVLEGNTITSFGDTSRNFVRASN